MATKKLRNVGIYGLETAARTVKVRNIAFYGIEQPDPESSVRQVSVAVLADDVRQANIRLVTPAVLSSIKRAPNFKQSGKSAVLAALNREYGTRFTEENLLVQVVEAVDENDFNSRVRIQANKNVQFQGWMWFRYRRYNLADAFKGKDLAGFIIGQDATVHGLIPALNATYELALTTVDLIDGPVKASNGSFVLMSATTSYWFLPNQQLIVGNPGPNLGRDLSVVQLSGWERPQA